MLVLMLGVGSPVEAQESPSFTIYLLRDGQATPVMRDGALFAHTQTDATILLDALLSGALPDEQAGGVTSPFPPGTQLAAVGILGQDATVDLHLPFAFLRNELDPDISDEIVDLIVKTLHPLGLHYIHVRAQTEDGSYLPLSDFLPRPLLIPPAAPANSDAVPDRLRPLPQPPGALPDHSGQPPGLGQGQPRGALSGKKVWLSAGHGWYWSDVLNRWTTQRGNNHDLVEDFSNAEAVNYYLARYLWNAGADVWLVRERSMSRHEVIVDNDDGAPDYQETGAWLTGSSPGYQDGTYRWASTFDTQSAAATWTPDLPEAGWYAVWAWYRHGANRTAEARYQIRHAGGKTLVSIPQEVHGLTWRYLGEYNFEAGRAGYVTLFNSSADPGQAVIADAIRFGGGVGTAAEPAGTSGKPRWEEAAKYWARYQGAPVELTEYDSTSRPLYAEWETAKGYPGDAGDSVYISWHTNAGGGTGTDSFIHDTDPTAGSAELQDAVHTQLVHDIRAAWDPQWVDRGQKRADFGEVRELSTMPGLLLEVAFHDTEDPGDAGDLREPVFRQIASRAVYQGIVQYFASRDGKPARLLPEPPGRLAARSTAPGQVTLTWSAPPCCDGVGGDAATSYKVYQSAGGRAFDDGTITTQPSLTLTGLPLGTLRFFRVTAINDGGESFPTPVVAVRTPDFGQQATFLIVDGFHRLDQAALVPQWESSNLGTDRRMFLERMNRYDYAVEHGQALAACGLAFDGAVSEAAAAGDVDLHNYPALDWFVGEDSAADVTLDDRDRSALGAYLSSGGRLLISGSNIGYDLVARGRAPAFYGDTLRTGYLGDDAGTHAFVGVSGGPFTGLAGSFDDGSAATYEVESADLLAPAAGSIPVLAYSGGTGGAAAVAYHGDFDLLNFGFPLETVSTSQVRNTLFCAAAEELLGKAPPPAGICSPRLINPGFEGGGNQAAWMVETTGGGSVFAHRDDLPPSSTTRSGDWLAWVGGRTPGTQATTVLAQAVALPSGEPSAALSLSWYVQPGAPGPVPADTLSVGIADENGNWQRELLALTGQSQAGSWQDSEFNLDDFAGQTVQVVIRASSDHTVFFIDDIILTTCGPQGAGEYRSLWVDAYHEGIKSRRQIDELVQTAKAGNFNALVVQVHRRGDTYYPSPIDPWAPDATRGFDALAYLLQQAHAAGIEVHAWMTTLAIWGGNGTPAAPEHTFNQHGPGTAGIDYWLMTSQAGEERADDQLYYLDPGHPDVVEHIVAISADLAGRYDLDGLHLDRIRYPWQNWGYNPTALARFQALTGRSDRPQTGDEQWQQWRRDQITGLVRRIYLTVTALKPQLRVSAALSTAGGPPGEFIPWQTRTPYTHHLQDWPAWLEEGIIDLGMTMTYRDEETYAGDFDGWIEWQKEHQGRRGIIIGSGLYLNDVDGSMAQWLRARQPSEAGFRPLGLAGYSYASPSNAGTSRRTFVNLTVTQVFTQPASAPAIPWKDAPSTGHLSGILGPAYPCRPGLDGHPLTLTGPQMRLLKADGSGWFGAVDLPPGQYLLSTDIVTPSWTLNIPLTITPGATVQKQVLLPDCRQPLHKLYLPLARRE